MPDKLLHEEGVALCPVVYQVGQFLRSGLAQRLRDHLGHILMAQAAQGQRLEQPLTVHGEYRPGGVLPLLQLGFAVGAHHEKRLRCRFPGNDVYGVY